MATRDIPDTVPELPVFNTKHLDDQPVGDEVYDVFKFGRELAGVQAGENGFVEGQKLLHLRFAKYPQEFAASSQDDTGAPDLYWGYGPATNAARRVSINPALYLNYEVDPNRVPKRFHGDGAGRFGTRLLSADAPISRMSPTQFTMLLDGVDGADPVSAVALLRARWVSHRHEFDEVGFGDPGFDEGADWVWIYDESRTLIDLPLP